MKRKKEKVERIVTSIKIKPSVWQTAKIEAIKHEKQLSELVEDAIKEWVDEHGK